VRSTYLLFAAGALSGAAVMYVASGRDDAPAAPSASLKSSAESSQPASAGPALRPVDFLTLVTGSIDVAERAALFRLAAEADRRTLEALAAQVAALPDIEGRRLALEALFTRYAELDAPAAAAFARTLDLPVAALKPLYVTWARRDARGALAGLGELAAREAMTLGVALLDVLGNDDLGIARILSAAPHLDPDGFRVEAAAAKAAQDPQAALAALLELPAEKAAAAFERLAVLFVERDVHGAIAAIDAIADDNRRNQLRAAVMRAWARLDPDALVDYIVDLDPQARGEALGVGGLQAFALVDPKLALRAADEIPGEAGLMMRSAALMSLAREDPLAALNFVETLPAGVERDRMLHTIAESYGEADPAAALAWAQGLGIPGVLQQAVFGIARVDAARAIDLVFTLPTANRENLLRLLVANNRLDAAQTAALADRVLAEAPRSRAVQTLANMWAQRAPADALPWLLAHSDSAASNAIPLAGSSLARRDPAAATAYLDRVPAELRAAWLSAVADGYAQNDPRAAASWIAQYSGERGYDAAAAAVAARMSRQDPAAAARLFASVDPALAPDAAANARTIGSALARQDPIAAASWARELPAATAPGATSVVAGAWVVRDAPAARNWVMSLPANEARDAALVQIVGATAGTTAADASLLDAFSSPAAQQRGIAEAARFVATRDSDVARELVNRYVTDPEVRRSAERFIAERAGYPFANRPPPRLPPP